MDFLTKLKDTFVSLPFFVKLLIGIVFMNILPPLGIGLIIFAIVLKKQDRNSRRDYRDYDRYKETSRESVKNSDKKIDDEFASYEKKINNEKIQKNNDHISDMKSAERILNKTKEYAKKGSLKEELKGIYSKMQSEYENAKKISLKINEINKMLSEPDWDLDKIKKSIQQEKNKNPQDPKRLERMYEMLGHVQQLYERKSRMCNQISDLNISFQTIYTKLTLLDIQEEGNFDEIESEIQRILDFQLKVDKYEDKLDRELKEFR